MGNLCGHFHRVPSCSFLHDVTIEGVENDLVSKLKRLIKVHSVLSDFASFQVALFLSLFEFSDPDFDEALELISSVSEITYSVNVERILTHTDCITLELLLLDMNLLVDSLAVFLDSLFQLFVVGEGGGVGLISWLSSQIFFVILELVFDLFELLS